MPVVVFKFLNPENLPPSWLMMAITSWCASCNVVFRSSFTDFHSGLDSSTLKTPSGLPSDPATAYANIRISRRNCLIWATVSEYRPDFHGQRQKRASILALLLYPSPAP